MNKDLKTESKSEMKEVNRDFEAKEILAKVDAKVEEKRTELKKREAIEKRKAELREKNKSGGLHYHGRLVIDPKYKKPGKVLRIDNDDMSTHQHLLSLGYTVVQDPDMNVGSGSLSEGHKLGSVVTIEQGINMSQPGILYEIDEDLLIARQELESEANDRQLQSNIEAYQRPDQRNK